MHPRILRKAVICGVPRKAGILAGFLAPPAASSADESLLTPSIFAPVSTPAFAISVKALGKSVALAEGGWSLTDPQWSDQAKASAS